VPCKKIIKFPLDENKEILVRAPHRAHEVILEVMKMHTDDAEVQRSAFNVIAALASIRNNFFFLI